MGFRASPTITLTSSFPIGQPAAVVDLWRGENPPAFLASLEVINAPTNGWNTQFQHALSFSDVHLAVPSLAPPWEAKQNKLAS